MTREEQRRRIELLMRQARLASERGDRAASIMLRTRLQIALSQYLNGAA